LSGNVPAVAVQKCPHGRASRVTQYGDAVDDRSRCAHVERHTPFFTDYDSVVAGSKRSVPVVFCVFRTVSNARAPQFELFSVVPILSNHNDEPPRLRQ